MTNLRGNLPPPRATPGIAGVAADAATLEAILPSLRTRLLRHARFALPDEGLAEDLVQDTLIVVVEQHATRRGDSALTTWAIAILKNKVADWYRSPARNRVVYVNADDEAGDDAIDALYSADGAYVEQVPAWQQPSTPTRSAQATAAPPAS